MIKTHSLSRHHAGNNDILFIYIIMYILYIIYTIRNDIFAVCFIFYKKRWKKVKLINHDCLPILMLYVMLAYLMLFAALSNAVCLYNASFFFIDFCKCF